MSTTVYVSGPMTGYVDWNRPAFHAAAAHLRAKGYEVVNPAELDAGMSDADLAETPHHVFIRRDIRVLLDCDLIYLLPGWKHSKGATLEKAVADGCGIDRLYDADREVWRSFEGEPEIEPGAHYRHCQPATGDGHGNEWCQHGEQIATNNTVEAEEPVRELRAPDGCPAFHTLGEGCTYGQTEDRPAEDGPSRGRPTVETEDLSAGLEIGQVIVDETMPPNTIRFETPAGSVDFDAHWDGHRLRLERKPEEHYLPGDAFPNVGYVRRMLGVTAAQLRENLRQLAERTDPASVDFGDTDHRPSDNPAVGWTDEHGTYHPAPGRSA